MLAANPKGIKNITLTAVFLALGMVLPLLTMQIKEIGDSLLPMHLAVMLCGLICGWKSGLVVGAVLPFLRSASFGMPPMYPNAVWMSFELAAYGFVIGILYSRFREKSLRNLFISLISSMLAGRIVWGIVKAILLGLGGKPFTFYMFIAGGFIDAVPGIVLQLILIPMCMAIANKNRNMDSIV